MAYMLLILEEPGQRQARGLEQGHVVYDRMLRFAADLGARGVLKGADALKTESTRVRAEVRDGKRALIDGPFAEAKEMVGGYFLLDCKTRDEALAIARDCPAAEWATVELREIGTCYE
jgi:hypothetical protein